MGKLDTKKMKISFEVDEFYQNNLIFNCKVSENRDNCFYPYYKLKTIFLNNNCNIDTCDINSIQDSDIVIYNDMPKVLPNKKDIGKSYLLIFESELIRPDNWDLEKHKYFNKIFTWNDKFIDNKKYFKMNFCHLFPEKIEKDISKKQKLCTLIAGNKHIEHPLELYSKRVEAIRWFEINHPDDFDLYGIGWDELRINNKYLRYILRKTKLSKLIKPNYPSYKGKVVSKNETLKKYKFSICYENARDIDGYITEKIFDCFFSGCVPVYWGANNITDHIPKECFIDKKDYHTYEELYEYMKNMSDKDYLKYLNNIETYLISDSSNEFKAEYFASNIVDVVLNDIN